MKTPTISQAYAMIRFLKGRKAEGDDARIRELQLIIRDQKERQAQLLLEQYDPHQVNLDLPPKPSKRANKARP